MRRRSFFWGSAVIRQKSFSFAFFAASREKNLLAKLAPNCGCTRSRLSLALRYTHFTMLNTFLGIAQIILSIALTAGVLLQSKGEELGGVFGGQQGVYQTRRGVDRLLFTITIFVAIAFFGLAIVNVILSAAN